MKNLLPPLVFLTFLGSASATTVTFNNVPGVVTFEQAPGVYNFVETITYDGFNFVSASSGSMAVWDDSSPNSNGRQNLIYADQQNVSSMALTRVGGGTFTLASVAMTLSWYEYDTSDPIVVSAILADGSIESQTLTLGQGLQNFPVNFADAREVDFSSITGEPGDFWLMDSFNYTVPVGDHGVTPEPASMALLGTGLLGTGWVYRKRRA